MHQDAPFYKLTLNVSRLLKHNTFQCVFMVLFKCQKKLVEAVRIYGGGIKDLFRAKFGIGDN